MKKSQFQKSDIYLALLDHRNTPTKQTNLQHNVNIPMNTEPTRATYIYNLMPGRINDNCGPK